jgi:hypothetical protein
MRNGRKGRSKWKNSGKDENGSWRNASKGKERNCSAELKKELRKLSKADWHRNRRNRQANCIKVRVVKQKTNSLGHEGK